MTYLVVALKSSIVSQCTTTLGDQMLHVDAALTYITTYMNDDIYHNDGKCYMDPDCNIELLINSVDQPLEAGMSQLQH